MNDATDQADVTRQEFTAGPSLTERLRRIFGGTPPAADVSSDPNQPAGGSTMSDDMKRS